MYKIVVFMEQRYLTEFDARFHKDEIDKIVTSRLILWRASRILPNYNSRMFYVRIIQEGNKRIGEIETEAKQVVALFGTKKKANRAIREFTKNNTAYSKCELCVQRTKL
jgi:hypothetical protein